MEKKYFDIYYHSTSNRQGTGKMDQKDKTIIKYFFYKAGTIF